MRLNNLVQNLIETSSEFPQIINKTRNKYFDISSENYWGFKITEKVYKLDDWLKGESKNYFTSNTASLSVDHPVRGFLERYVAGLSVENSYNMRSIGIGFRYGGLGLLLYKGLDYSRKIFKIKEKESEKAYAVHDTLYYLGVDLILNPFLYLLAGEHGIKKIAIATAVNSLASLPPGGYINGYMIDIGRDLMGVQESKRTPKFLKNAHPMIKKAAFVGIVGLSFTLSSLYYTKNQRMAAMLSQTQIEGV